MTIRRFAFAAAGLLFLSYFGALAGLFTLQRFVLYGPSGTVEGPAAVGLAGVAQIFLTTEDGETIRAWHKPAYGGQPTILFFHGNSASLENRADAFRQIVGDGFGLLAITYRGYPGSTGSPSQKGLISDGLAAFDWLAERTDHIILHGQSLGSGVAAQIAARRKADALVLEVPFSSTVDVAVFRYPIFPVRLLMWDRWETDEIITDLDEPILILAAEHDRVIPQGHAEHLFAVAPEPKRLVTLARTGHNSMWRNGMWNRIKAWLAGPDARPTR